MPFDDAGFLRPTKIVNKGRVAPLVKTDAGRILKRLGYGTRWVRGAFRLRYPGDDEMRYCLVGAIQAEWPLNIWKRRRMYDRIKEATGMPNVITFNDSRQSFADVRKVLRKLEQEEINALR